MAAILDLVNFHSFKGLKKNAIPFFSDHYYVPKGNKRDERPTTSFKFSLQN